MLRREGYHVWWGGKNDLFAVETPEDYLNYCDEKLNPESFPGDYHMPPPLPGDHPMKGVFYQGVMTRDEEGPVFKDRDQAHVDGALELIKAADEKEPFCAFLPLSWPHPAYVVEDAFYDRIDPDHLPPRIQPPDPDLDLPGLTALREAYGSDKVDEAGWTDLKRVFYAMSCKIDHQFGQVVQALKDRGIYDNTLIIFLSDHGDFAGDYGLPEKTHFSLQDSLLRVPFLIKPPASFKTQPGVRTHLTELIDMTATIYDLLDIDPGYGAFGRSLRESLQGDNREIREAVFAEVGARKGEDAFRNRGANLMAPDSFYGIQSRVNRGICHDGSYAVSCRTPTHKYVRRGYTDHHELYDRRQDPEERHNLCGNPDYAATENDMERLLLDYFMRTGDILPYQQDSRSV